MNRSRNRYCDIYKLTGLRLMAGDEQAIYSISCNGYGKQHDSFLCTAVAVETVSLKRGCCIRIRKIYCQNYVSLHFLTVSNSGGPTVVRLTETTQGGLSVSPNQKKGGGQEWAECVKGPRICLRLRPETTYDWLHYIVSL